MSHNIAPDLEHLAVGIDEIQPFPGNPRIGDREMIRESLRVNGQYKPLVIQASTGHICVGNNTWHAAKAEGWDSVAVQRLDLTDAQAKKILAVDNKSADAADYDERLLAEMLRDIEDLEGTGFTPGDLDDMLAELEPAGAPAAQEFTDWSSPAVGTPMDAPHGTDSEGRPLEAFPAPRQSGGSYEDVIELDAPPATEARYAESDEEFAARSTRSAQQTPHSVKGVAEMILVYPVDDREEAARLIDATREVFGSEARASEIVLRALRTLVAVLDARHDPGATISVSTLLKAAGAEQEEEAA